MSLHKLSAGSGYTYLTRQVAVHDATHAVHRDGLAAYYEERGECPGRWYGSGLEALGIEPGSIVTETQMHGLFALGRHPNTDAIFAEMYPAGVGLDVIDAATRLGKPFPPAADQSELSTAVEAALQATGRTSPSVEADLSPAELARIRTDVAAQMFRERYARDPKSATEFSTFIAEKSRTAAPAVAGYDLTFSPVKSVSVLWALADDAVATEVRAAHDAAVANVMRWLEQEAVYTRQGRNGCRQVDTRGLIAAAFTHRDNRNGDPDLHTHVAVSNKVQALDGSWLALDGRVLHAAAVAASERYNTRIEAELRKRLGVRFVERPGTDPEKRPVREIDGIDPVLIEMWSSRRSCIEDRQAELSRRFQAEHGRPPTPIESIALAQQATLETRSAKHAPRTEREQRSTWHGELDRSQAAGHDVSKCLDRPAAPAHDMSLSDRLTTLASQVIEKVSGKRATWRRWNVIAESERLIRASDLDPQAVDQDVATVVAEALQTHSIKLGTPDAVEIPEALRRRDGTSVYTTAGAQLYSSDVVMKAEAAILELAATKGGPAVTNEAVDIAALESAANGITLNDGQVAMVRDLVTSGNVLQVAIAPAGAGKTAALRVAARAWKEQGGRVLGLAPSAAAAKVLGDALGEQCETIAKLIHEVETWRGRSVEELKAHPLPEWITHRDRTLVIVDEAGMASTRDLRVVARLFGKSGGVVRLVGDDRQLASVAAGGVLRDIADKHGAARLDKLMRFDDPSEAAATLAVRDGDADGLRFHFDSNRVHVGDSTTTLESALDAWAADIAAGRHAILLAGTRRQVRSLNMMARQRRLAAEGASEVPSVGLRDDLEASVGDPIITTRNRRNLQLTATDWVKNGDRFTVQAVEADGRLTVRHDDTGRHITLPADYVATHVALGYATTIHRAQGSTADISHTVVGGTETRQQLYVAISRGRAANHLHVALPAAPDEHPGLDTHALEPRSAQDILERVVRTDGSQRSATSTAAEVLPLRDQLKLAIERYTDAVDLVGGPASTQPPPVPWVAAPPITDDPALRDYLSARTAHIAGLSRQLGDLAIARAPFVRGNDSELLQLDPELLDELAVWRALYTRTPWEHRPPRPPAEAAAYYEDLAARVRALPTHEYSHTINYRPIVDAINPAIAQSDDWPQFAREINRWTGALFGEGIVDVLADAARNVPDDLADYAEQVRHRFNHLVQADYRRRVRERDPRVMPERYVSRAPRIEPEHAHELYR